MTITLGTFLTGLLIVSVFVGLMTEAVKKIFDDIGVKYKANLVAGASAVVLSIAVGTAYMIFTETAINAQMAVYLIALVFLSWLSAMVGYDKVRQTILQIGIKENLS